MHQIAFDLGSFSELHHLNEAAEWESVCKVRMKPETFDLEDHPSVAITKEVLEDFHDAILDIVGSSSCSEGSLRHRSRRISRVAARLDELLYKPRDVGGNANQTIRGMEEIRKWSNLGLHQRDVFQAYETQFETTMGILARFYVTQLGFTEDHAQMSAYEGLAAAFSGSFAFGGSNNPFGVGEKTLREAILDGLPIEDIRQIVSPEVDAINSYSRTGDSLFNSAIRYPEALEYLLELGGDPNQQNGFGKTPLMYA